MSEPVGWVCNSPKDLEQIEAFTRSKEIADKYRESGWCVEALYDGFAVSRHSERFIQELEDRIEEYDVENLALRGSSQEKDYTIVQLEGEVEFLRSQISFYHNEYVKYSDFEQVQSELTKALSLVNRARRSDGISPNCPLGVDLAEFLAHQSAPATKDACSTCQGTKLIDDGEIYASGGVEYENGSVKCVKDCPDCS